jgi:hypothetical protein
MSSLRVALLLPMLALAGCATEAEIREAQQARIEADRFSCLEQGFEQGTDSFALCQLLLQTNRRLDALSSRIAFMESDIRRLDTFGFPYRRWR